MYQNIKKIFILCSIIFMITACQENFDNRCQREAKEYTQRFCPQKMDENITLDSTTYDKGSRTYRYYYSIDKNANTASIRAQLKSRENDFRSKLLLMLINSVQLKPYKDKGINFEYIYTYTDESSPFIKIHFSHNDYTKGKTSSH